MELASPAKEGESLSFQPVSSGLHQKTDPSVCGELVM